MTCDVEAIIEEIRLENKEVDLEEENKKLLECLEDMEKKLEKYKKYIMIIIEDREELREELEKEITKNDDLEEFILELKKGLVEIREGAK